MSVGLRPCALEFTSKQLKVLAHLTVSGLLPESFPHAQWVIAVQRSFCTQEDATCTCSAEWKEVRRILELVRLAYAFYTFCGLKKAWSPKTLGAIACPPALLTMSPAKKEDKLYLVHYESDELCNWSQDGINWRNVAPSFFFLPCRARHDSSDGRSRLHTIRTQLKRSHS